MTQQNKNMPKKSSNQARKSCTFKLPPELYKRLQHYAIDNDLEYSEVVQSALQELLKNYCFRTPLQTMEESQ